MLDIDSVIKYLKECELSESEVASALSPSERCDNDLRSFCAKVDKVHYVDVTSFSLIKKNISKVFKGQVQWARELNCLNCFFMINKEQAYGYFESSVSELDSKWLSLFLASEIGRDVSFSLTVYNDKRKTLSRAQAEVFEKYLVSQKVGLSFSELGSDELVEVKEKFNYGSRRLKIAVIVSGQLRGYELAKESWDAFFLGHDVDYFVHTWSEVGSVKKADFMNKRVNPASLKNFLVQLEKEDSEVANHLYSELMGGGRVGEQELKRVYGGSARVVVEEDTSSLSNPEKMYYKIKRSFELIDDPLEYDLVVRIRPDLIIKELKRLDWTTIYEESLSGKLFLGYGYSLNYYGFGVDDKFAMGSPESMLLYSNLWDERDSYKPLLGHISLASYLFEYQVDVVPLNDYFQVQINDCRPLTASFFRRLIEVRS